MSGISIKSTQFEWTIFCECREFVENTQTSLSSVGGDFFPIQVFISILLRLRCSCGHKMCAADWLEIACAWSFAQPRCGQRNSFGDGAHFVSADTWTLFALPGALWSLSTFSALSGSLWSHFARYSTTHQLLSSPRVRFDEGFGFLLWFFFRELIGSE